MNKNIKIITIIGLILVVGALSVGYAALSKKLTINGTADINASTWSIDLQTPSCTKTGDATFSLPATDGTTITFSDIKLSLPGDSVTCTIPVKNTGTIDANLESINITAPSNVSNDYKCYVTYDGINYNTGATFVNSALDASAIKNATIKFEFDSAATTVPSTPVSLSGLKVDLNYVQA